MVCPPPLKKMLVFSTKKGGPHSEIAGERELFPKKGKGVKLSFFFNEKRTNNSFLSLRVRQRTTKKEGAY